jgi:predicted metalloendopeptidase
MKRQLAMINKPLDKTQWTMTPSTVDACGFDDQHH